MIIEKISTTELAMNHIVDKLNIAGEKNLFNFSVF